MTDPNTTVSFRLTREEVAVLEQLCGERNQTVSEVARDAIRAYLAAPCPRCGYQLTISLPDGLTVTFGDPAQLVTLGALVTVIE